MSKKQTIKIVTLINNDPILGVQYGEKEITIAELLRQKHIDRYLRIKARNGLLIAKNRTTQK